MIENVPICGITGEATVRVDGRIPWVGDAEIHVTDELLACTDARNILEQRYRVGEACQYLRGTRHARLKEADRG